MPPLIARLTSEGQFMLPRELRDVLGVKPGDYLALTATPDGVLISAADSNVRRQREGEAALIQLVRDMGAALEAEGITDEEQLDADIKEAKREAFRQQHGHLGS